MNQHKRVNISRFLGAGLIGVLVLLFVINTHALSDFGLVENTNFMDSTKEILVDYNSGARRNMPFQPEWIQEFITNAYKPKLRVDGFFQEGNELYVRVKNLGSDDEDVEVILTFLDSGKQEKNYLKVDKNEALYTVFFLDEEPGEYYVQVRLEVDNISHDVAHFPLFI